MATPLQKASGIAADRGKEFQGLGERMDGYPASSFQKIQARPIDPSIAAQQKLGAADADPSIAAQRGLNG